MIPCSVKLIIFRLALIFIGTIAAVGIYYILHERFGGPFMFVMVDPPAADPSRDLHVALSWITIYAMLGFVGGAIATIGISRLWQTTLALLPAFVIVLFRTQGKFSYFMTEEGVYGVFFAIIFALIAGLLVFAITKKL